MLKRAAQALNALMDISRLWAEQGQTVLTQTLGAAAVPGPWTHYPGDDAHDAELGYRWYYHGHPGQGRSAGEHGHFHLFADAADGGAAVTHLIAVSVDPYGRPRELFAPNRWVTDETWQPAALVLRMIRSFDLKHPQALGGVHLWLKLVLAAFMPQVIHTVKARDQRLRALQAGLKSDVFEDRRVPVLGRCGVDLGRQVQAIERWCARQADDGNR